MISPRRTLETIRRTKLRRDARWQLTPPHWPAADDPQRIAIVGAGVAGLSAGVLLRELGHEVTLFEAHDRPGGRILTLRDPFDDGLSAEAGAFRIADSHLHTHYWARRLRLPLVPVYPDRGRLALQAREGPRLDVNARWLSAHRFDHLLTGRADQERSRTTGALRRFLRETLRQSTWTRIAGGMDRLPRTLAQSLGPRIEYGSAVERVEQQRAGVRLHYACAGQSVARSFDRVIMAVPLTTLGAIGFEPALGPVKQQATRTVGNADSIRFFIQLRDRGWMREGRLCGFGATLDGIEFWHPAANRRTARGLLVLNAQGAAAAPFLQLDRDARLQRARRRAVELFPEIEGRIEQVREFCWSEDPWACGAQSRVDQAGIARAALGACEGRIHFAGEFTASNWIDGALQSAHRVVGEIARAPAHAAERRASHPEALAVGA